MTEETEKKPVTRIKRKSRGRPRNKVLTSKERSAKTMKGRPTPKVHDRAKPRKTGRRGRPAFVMPFHEARAIIHSENLSSRNDFLRWWNLNIPARIPKNPIRTYAGDWKGWGDFLNSHNAFPDTKIVYRPFHDARTYARSLMLKTQTEWVKLAREGKIPKDIPKWPNLAYGRTIYTEKPKRGGYWVSWKDWLGISFVDKMQAMNSKIEIVVLTHMQHFPQNVFAFVLYNDFEIDIIRRLREDKVNVIKAYHTNDKFDWGRYMDAKFSRYYEMPGVYMIPNVNEVFYTFDMQMSTFDAPRA